MARTEGDRYKPTTLREASAGKRDYNLTVNDIDKIDEIQDMIIHLNPSYDRTKLPDDMVFQRLPEGGDVEEEESILDIIVVSVSCGVDTQLVAQQGATEEADGVVEGQGFVPGSALHALMQNLQDIKEAKESTT